MKLTLIRSATMRVSYAGHELLTDPYFAPKHSRPSFAGISPNPLVDLPCSPAEILQGVELVIISHLHSDHFDPEAQRLLPKHLPIVCQAGDEERITSLGFASVRPISDKVVWNGIQITRVPGQHGSGAVLDEMGVVSGFVFQADQEPTVYWAGDTIWCEPVADAIEQYRPEVIITHSSGAVWKGSGPIIMDEQDTIQVCKASPNSTVIAIHLDSLDHGTVTRSKLRAFAEREGISHQYLLIPVDGELLELGGHLQNPGSYF